MVAQRIGLTSRRCSQLESIISQFRHRLLNGGATMQPEDSRWTEGKIFDLEKALHDERLTLWRDLLPLAETARDAAVDSLRSAWLNDLARTLGHHVGNPGAPLADSSAMAATVDLTQLPVDTRTHPSVTHRGGAN